MSTQSPRPDEPATAWPGPGALPLVAIAGTRGKSTVLWLFEAMLAEAGWATGVWSSSGVYVSGIRQAGELGPWSRVLEAARAGSLEIAVQELETPLVTGVGLPVGIYPLAAITTLCGNSDECLVSTEGAQGAIAQSIVARAVRPDGRLILNADDQAVLTAADDTRARVSLFALHPENPALRRQLRSGGDAVWVDDGTVMSHQNGATTPVVAIERARFTLDGALIFQVQNLLCAVALGAAIGLSPEHMRRAVTEFLPDRDRLPGRCNIEWIGNATVIVDTAQQVWTLRSLIRGVRHQPHRRTITVAGPFPDLPESQLQDAGRLIGRLGGAVILHAEELHRPRLDRLIDGIAQNEIPPLVLSMPNESSAIDHALRMLGDGDICLLVTDDVERAFAIIDRFRG